MNNFKRLFEEEEAAFEQMGRNEVFANLQTTMLFFRMLGDVAEVYLTGMVDVLSSASSPNTDPIRKNINPPDQPLSGPPPLGPNTLEP